MRIVLDTNVLVSGIFWKGIPYRILESWIKDEFQLLITEEILQEYQKILTRISKGKNIELINNWAMLIVENSIVIHVKHKFKLSIDPDDNKFIDCAVAGNARYIVSGDYHLLDIKTVMNIEIIKPQIFLKKL
ncbi:MAG: putative toxin-antitoxin system toxin component, PIN family [Chitinivibrionales bacterium]|nr:putative toxin-antitoxin system toxin component, PIN family [Chitinivibrionales bacterium]